MSNPPPPPPTGGTPPPPSAGGWGPPPPAAGGPPPPPTGPPAAGASDGKGKKGCLWAGLGVLALVIVIGVIVAVAGGGDDSETADTTSTIVVEVEDAAAEEDVATTVEEATTTTAAAAGTCAETPADDSFDSKSQDLYPDRIGVQDDDHEAAVGDCVRIAGLTVWVNGATTGSVQFLADELVVVDVRILNRDSSTKSYNLLEWKLQLPSGQIINPSFVTPDGTPDLSSGEIAGGGEASGAVAFEAPPGEYFVIYEPLFAMGGDRGVWQINL